MAISDPSVYGFFMRAVPIVNRAAADLLFERGVTPLEAWLLEEIPADGRACASELAGILEVPTSTVTRALRRMESYEYLTLRKGHFRDVRVLLATLTPMGIMVRDSVRGFESELDGLLLRGIGQKDFAWLLKGLTHIARAGEAYLQPASVRRRGDAGDHRADHDDRDDQHATGASDASDAADDMD